MDPKQLAAAFVTAACETLVEGMQKIEHCILQLNEEQIWWRPQSEMNSIANLMLHLSGNVQQWIVAGIGGDKDIRNRPLEFSDHSQRPKAEILARLQKIVREAVAVLEQLRAEQLVTARRIQGFDTNVTAAAFDSISHFCGHVQEIIHMTREQLGDRYHFYFVPVGPEQASAGTNSPLE